jgi:hypothetical protein
LGLRMCCGRDTYRHEVQSKAVVHVEFPSQKRAGKFRTLFIDLVPLLVRSV